LGQELGLEQIELGQKQSELEQGQQELGQELGQELRAELEQEQTLYSFILEKLSIEPLSRQEMMIAFNLKKVSGYLNRTIFKLLDKKLIERTIPGTPNHPAQKFRITERGKMFLELLDMLKKKK